MGTGKRENMDHFQRSCLNTFVARGADRAHLQRKDEERLAQLLQDPATGIVPIWREQVCVTEDPEPGAARFSPGVVEPFFPTDERVLVFLGEEDGRASFAAVLAEDGPEPPALPGAGVFRELRAVAPLLSRHDAALLAYAKSIVYWHARTRFCGACGKPAASADGGHVRICTDPACGRQYFPRTDPAVIVLVLHGTDLSQFQHAFDTVRWPWVAVALGLDMNPIQVQPSEVLGLLRRDVAFHPQEAAVTVKGRFDAAVEFGLIEVGRDRPTKILGHDHAPTGHSAIVGALAAFQIPPGDDDFMSDAIPVHHVLQLEREQLRNPETQITSHLQKERVANGAAGLQMGEDLLLFKSIEKACHAEELVALPPAAFLLMAPSIYWFVLLDKPALRFIGECNVTVRWLH